MSPAAPPPESKSSPCKPSPCKPCPICGKPASAAMHPFCSRRCADVDLHRWLGGAYALPAEESEEPDAEAPDTP